MQQLEIINAFIKLGNFLKQFKSNQKDSTIPNNEMFFDDFRDLLQLSQSHNGWYTIDNVIFAIDNWANTLNQKKFDTWLSPYHFDKNLQSKTVAIILAGNVPLVGFHDFLSVLVSGHRVVVKTSSNDQKLLPFLCKYLVSIAPKLQDKIEFVDGKLDNFDAVIATGSNNTARYFEYYFKNKPSIIRKSRNSIAVLDGNESPEQMNALGEDIFRYFGLGCRNVSKIFVPYGYNFDLFFNGVFSYQDVIKYEKYANNYDYNKAVFLMSDFKLLDNEFLVIKKDSSYSSPIASVFYEYYDNLEQLQQKINIDKNLIQCVVSNNLIPNSVNFGQTQHPNLWDYADGVDTLDFLIGL